MATNRRHQGNRRQKPAAAAPEQVFLEAVLQAVWSLLKLLLTTFAGLFGRAGRSEAPATAQQVRQLQEHWQQVEFYIMQEQTRALAVSEADKLLDAALKLRGLSGQTTGERLKAARTRFEPALYQQLWNAHKLRNGLAHEIGSTVSADQARQAVASFRSALYQLNILS